VALPLQGEAAPARAGDRPRQRWKAAPAAAVVAVIGLAITLAATVSAVVLDRRNERSLLDVQTRQAAAVLGSTVLQISQPLMAAAEIAQVTQGNATAFRESIGGQTGPQGLFVSAVLVEVRGTAARPLASVGIPPLVDPVSQAGAASVRRALASPTFVVTGIGGSPVSRVGYAYATGGNTRYVIYAERGIPPNHRVPAESNPAFADLHFATYIGPDVTAANLATTDVDPASLPLTGETAREMVPFGDTVITLVATASHPLGGSLGRQLPWIFLVGGLLLTALVTTWTAQMIRRRETAEQDAATIQALYGRLDGLYAEQRTIAETLQRALLPRANPPIPGLATAFRYVAGADGVDVGGDWYSVVRIDDSQVAFVVGDVSGRGVSAAALMARLRFTIRAYLLEGHGPDVVLQMCADHIDIVEDDHFATVLVGLVDLPTRRVTLANAGHPEPLVVSEGKAVYASTEVGPPLGTSPARYRTTSFTMRPGSLLLAYTDGIVERRDEHLDVGLARLAAAVTVLDTRNLDAGLDEILRRMVPGASEDDIALLALGWTQ
jgi:serine phosphatase RsbU (regulator of sigma subunit)/type II secretory pathway pseudopilin PulG